MGKLPFLFLILLPCFHALPFPGTPGFAPRPFRMRQVIPWGTNMGWVPSQGHDGISKRSAVAPGSDTPQQPLATEGEGDTVPALAVPEGGNPPPAPNCNCPNCRKISRRGTPNPKARFFFPSFYDHDYYEDYFYDSYYPYGGGGYGYGMMGGYPGGYGGGYPGYGMGMGMGYW